MDHTIDAVRLALNLQELRARTASANVAGASRADAVAQRYDFAKVETALREAAHAGDGATAAHWLRTADAALRELRPESDGAIRLDEEIAELSAASVDFQTLTEALGRRFGLMRIAISGRA